MRVSYSPRALIQLEDILNYIAAEDPIVAAAVANRIAKLVSLLGEHPYLLGRPTEKTDVRVLTVPRYPYVIFNKVLAQKDEVRILRVRHAARRPLKGAR